MQRTRCSKAKVRTGMVGNECLKRPLEVWEETDDLGIIFSCPEQQWQRLVSDEILIEVSEVGFCVFLWGRGGDNICTKDCLINWKMGCVLVSFLMIKHPD